MLKKDYRVFKKHTRFALNRRSYGIVFSLFNKRVKDLTCSTSEECSEAR